MAFFKKKYQGQVVRSLKNKSSKKGIFILAGGLAVLLTLVFWPESKGPEAAAEKETLSDEMIQKKIKEHSEQTYFKNKLMRENILFEAQKQTPPESSAFGEDSLDDRFDSKAGVDLSPEPLFDELLAAIETSEPPAYQDIEDEIQNFEPIESTLKSYKEENTEDNTDFFVQEFLKLARKRGYNIELDEDLNVISIVSIK